MACRDPIGARRGHARWRETRRSRQTRPHTHRWMAPTILGVALLIASDLRKDMAGKPLLGGVSFKLERRERLTIAGRNGAGKTTLLRMIAGEETIDRGELSVSKGVRIALHDQRPPRERGMSLRDYVLSGCVEELAVERELA